MFDPKCPAALAVAIRPEEPNKNKSLKMTENASMTTLVTTLTRKFSPHHRLETGPAADSIKAMGEMMNETKPPDAEPALTLFRFCAKHHLRLDNRERSAIGVELSKLAREREIPRRRVSERVGPGEWCKSRVYPEAFLREWLTRYRKAKQAESKTQEPAQPTADS